MQFDKIIMNPPYDNGLGGKITFDAISLLKEDKDCICLMPLSNYKNKSAELWRYVKTFELADPKLFVDADITKNLCICTFENKNVDKYRSYEDIEMESYDPRFKVFYEVNSKLPLRYVFRRCDNAKAEDFNKDLDFLESNRLCDGVSGGGGFGRGGSGWKWNYEGDTNLGAGLAHIHFSKKCEKDSFCTWWYSNKKRKSLASLLQIGLSLKTVSSTCSIAIPQIDWETISDTPLWREGKYDEAVLDVMGLTWDEEKNNIVRRVKTN